MKPRDRVGHDSIASDAPAGHSAPIPIPRSARKKNRNEKLGEKPAMKLQTEYQMMEIISGILRPIRSASQPEAVAPSKRSQRVMVNTAVTAVNGTPNSCEIGTMINRKTVKSNASSVQPIHAAIQAIHWSLVGSLHHGIAAVSIVTDISALPFSYFEGQARPEGGCHGHGDGSRWQALPDAHSTRFLRLSRHAPGSQTSIPKRQPFDRRRRFSAAAASASGHAHRKHRPKGPPRRKRRRPE